MTSKSPFQPKPFDDPMILYPPAWMAANLFPAILTVLPLSKRRELLQLALRARGLLSWMSAAQRGMLRPPPPPPKFTFPSPMTCKNQTLNAAPGTPFPPCFYLNLCLLLQAPENKPSSGNNKFPHFQFAVFLPAAPVSPLSSRATLLITEAAAPGRGIDGEGGSIQISAASPHKSLPGAGLCFPKPWGVAGLGIPMLWTLRG